MGGDDRADRDAEYEERLSELGLVLPQPATAQGSYVPALAVGQSVWVSGQLPVKAGELTVRGRVGEQVSLGEAQDAARLCAANVLGVLKATMGSLGGIAQIVHVSGFVAAAPEFEDHPVVVNAASEVFLHVLRERGRHSRVAVGVSSLPLGSPVEIAAVVASS